MHAWVKDGRIHQILPQEFEPEEMGKIYRLSRVESEALDELASIRIAAQAAEARFHRLLAHTLVKEQGDD